MANETSTSVGPSVSTATINDTTEVKSKRRRFRIKGKKMAKSFKGFVTGKSRKERRMKKANTMEPITENQPLDTTNTNVNLNPVLNKNGTSPTSNSSVGGDDESTVYGASMTTTAMKVDVDDSSVLSEPVVDPVQVVLLIMDPISRGFELLLLEFDSTKSTIKDILEQIPLTATEESFRTQSFDIIFDTEGKEMKLDSFVADYIEKAGVVIAVPNGSYESGEQVAKMALPILSDKDVSETFASSGIDIPSAIPVSPDTSSTTEEETPNETVTEEVLEVKDEPVPAVTEEIPTPEPAVKETEVTSESSSSSIYLAAVTAIISFLLFQTHQHYKSPLQPGDLLAPGAWRSPCGLLKSIPSELYTCDRKTLRMETDGKLIMYDEEEKSIFYLSGGDVCDGTKSKCMGTTIDADGSVFVAGAIPVTLEGTIPTDGWPFGEGTVIPTVKKRGKR